MCQLQLSWMITYRNLKLIPINHDWQGHVLSRCLYVFACGRTRFVDAHMYMLHGYMYFVARSITKVWHTVILRDCLHVLEAGYENLKIGVWILTSVWLLEPWSIKNR